MGKIYYTDTVSLHVDNPGHGELLVEDATPTAGPHWARTLYGAQLGTLLTYVTTLALQHHVPDDWRRLLPRHFAAAEARTLLPILQEAIVVAAAGTERCERVFADLDEPPAEPLCLTCNHGTVYSSTRTRSAWCADHGHTAFGWNPSLSWADVQDRHKGRVARWQQVQDARPAIDTSPAP